MDETKKLAKFVTDIRYEDFDNKILEKAKYLILDQLGCQIAFASLPVSKIVYQYVREKNSGNNESTVTYYGLKTSIEEAAFANAIFGHGFEMDDVDMQTASHPGVVVIPAILAAGEAAAVSGKELLTAMIAGYDIMLRAGKAAVDMMFRSFQTTITPGPFGAAAAVAKIRNFDEKTTLNALGIAGSATGGLGEYTISGGTVKRMLAGTPSQAGVRAALLAELGMTGPTTIMEGKKGFCQAYSDKYDLDLLTEDLGLDFRIMQTGTKPYCCCAGQHTAIDATIALMEKTSAKPEDIESMTVYQRAREAQNVGNVVNPTDVVSAQFSGRFGMAMRIVRGGNGFSDYTMANVNDAGIQDLAKKIDWVEYPHEDLPVGTGPAKVTMKLKDGTTAEELVVYAKGTVQNPMTNEELITKFKDLSCQVLSGEKMEEIIQLVTSLEDVENIHQLTSLLTV